MSSRARDDKMVVPDFEAAVPEGSGYIAAMGSRLARIAGVAGTFMRYWRDNFFSGV